MIFGWRLDFQVASQNDNDDDDVCVNRSVSMSKLEDFAVLGTANIVVRTAADAEQTAEDERSGKEKAAVELLAGMRSIV